MTWLGETLADLRIALRWLRIGARVALRWMAHHPWWTVLLGSTGLVHLAIGPQGVLFWWGLLITALWAWRSRWPTSWDRHVGRRLHGHWADLATWARSPISAPTHQVPAPAPGPAPAVRCDHGLTGATCVCGIALVAISPDVEGHPRFVEVGDVETQCDHGLDDEPCRLCGAWLQRVPMTWAYSSPDDGEPIGAVGDGPLRRVWRETRGIAA